MNTCRNGAAGIKKIFIKGSSGKHGRTMFRAVNVRPWEFKEGFANFDKANFSKENKVIFPIEVISRAVPAAVVKASDAKVEKTQAKATERAEANGKAAAAAVADFSDEI